MIISIASDHAGYDLRQKVIAHLESKGIEVIDGGAESADKPYNYVEAGTKIAEDVLSGRADRGIAICGTGIGISVVVNKFKGIRCGTCTNEYMARMSRQHNDANVIAIGARVVGQAVALAMVDAFLEEGFAGDRHQERVNDIKTLENRNFK
ncbi:MAG: ribose 5-phosphate isomerase B [Clostridiales bacterium]|nr:ribose 5-phosphate isomerase B [Clostridiales bacterium]